MSALNRLNFGSIYECQHPVLLRDGSAAIDARQGWITKDDGTRSWQYINKKRVLLPVRCGKCSGCRKFQQDEWFCRLRHEHLYNSRNSGTATGFLTLTFNPKEYENALQLVTVREDGKKDYTEIYRRYIVPYKKRLRATRGENLDFRFYCTNEFGEERGRFHLHLIIFFKGLDSKSYISGRKQFCERYRDFRHSVKTYDNGVAGFRLQTDDEMYLQCKLLRQWCCDSSRHTDLDKRLYTKRHKIFKGYKDYETRSTHAIGEYGHVTFFITRSVGMIKYVTNYVLKCIKDGVTTYHRQSPAVGLDFAKNDPEILNCIRDLKPVCSCGMFKGRSLTVPLPRFYVRKLGDKSKQIEQFWKSYPEILRKYCDKHLDETKKLINLHREESQIGYNTHFYDNEVIDMPDFANLPDLPLYMCV